MFLRKYSALLCASSALAIIAIEKKIPNSSEYTLVKPDEHIIASKVFRQFPGDYGGSRIEFRLIHDGVPLIVTYKRWRASGPSRSKTNTKRNSSRDPTNRWYNRLSDLYRYEADPTCSFEVSEEYDREYICNGESMAVFVPKHGHAHNDDWMKEVYLFLYKQGVELCLVAYPWSFFYTYSYMRKHHTFRARLPLFSPTLWE